MNTHAAGLQLADQIGEILEAAQLRAVAQLDPTATAQALADGTPAILIGPPRVEFVTYNEAVTTWTLFIIAPPAGDYPAAWPALDQLAGALREPLDLDSLDPAEFQPSSGPAYPAFAATCTIHYTDLDN